MCFISCHFWDQRDWQFRTHHGFPSFSSRAAHIQPLQGWEHMGTLPWVSPMVFNQELFLRIWIFLVDCSGFSAKGPPLDLVPEPRSKGFQRPSSQCIRTKEKRNTNRILIKGENEARVLHAGVRCPANENTLLFALWPRGHEILWRVNWPTNDPRFIPK